MTFDPITGPTTSLGELREPVFVFPEQESAGLARLDDDVSRNGRRPNILVILMDDVDRLAAGGLRLTSCYSEPTCTPSRASQVGRG